MALTFNKIFTIIFVLGMLTSNILTVLPTSEESEDKLNSLNQSFEFLNNQDFLLNTQRSRTHSNYYYSEDSLIDNLEEDNQIPSVKCTTPIMEELVIANPQRSNNQDSNVKKSVSEPTDYTEFYRGDNIDISGKLWDGVTFWDNENVEIYYNITQAQFLADIATYRASSYRIVDVLTDSLGDFSYSLLTSDLSIDMTSKVGDITIFTWFNGNYPEGRYEGSAGFAIATVYGQVRLDVIPTVGNRDSPYSFYIELNFENGTQATTAGTNFNIKVEWVEAGETHVDGIRTFAGSNDFLYANTAPVAISNVTCDTSYDLTNLPFFNFKVFGDATMSETIVYNTTTGETYDKVEVKAYYDTGAILDDSRIDVALDSFIIL
ncbi:MAG: hypothetical protein H7641_13185, partial [Candidatus Heimdallarchaeota archaeon]|nr:hypothetical protein [Candidatus Heimdallarchaeota archaeon]MCK4878514.1 hypothetical protein [Candidatus Heimdallarchaeota archaeon]